MTTDDLETLLQAQEESPSLEFKASMPWDVRSLAKDLLAMANVQDGGVIVIGVEDETWLRKGIETQHRDSYNVQTMRDQMAAYADPHIQFTSGIVRDRADMEFIVIEIRPFDEVPVICCKDSSDTRAGTMYYRSAERRTASAAVSNSYDLRTIIDRATVKMMQKRRAQGYTVQGGGRQELDEELGDL